METQHVTLDRKQARELYQAYKKHQHYSQPLDYEVQRTYQLLAQGKIVIKAIESIVTAGLKPDGTPKLAICRADALSCELRMDRDGSATMKDRNYLVRTHRKDRDRRWEPMDSRSIVTFPKGSFARKESLWSAEALVPTPPLHLRPARGLANYHILWEAEWTRIVPRDPMLLRRIGKGDLWLVCAHWDLTEVERAALATRIR